ncbi:UNVERIFIED_CONTAM: hypothetical protein NCL1_34722 [Trichonephila clavipes]
MLIWIIMCWVNISHVIN